MQKNHRLIDNLPDSYDTGIDTLRSIDPDLPDFCWRIITGYSPNKPNAAWTVVRP